MVIKSRGPRRRTREKFRGPKKLTVNRLLGNFSIGERVAIVIASNSQRGQPFKRFHGKTGKVIEKRGSCFVIEVKDGKKTKHIISAPEHLKRV